nr:heme exporter protein CcmD [uncultured Roseateles sp.]
MTMTVWNSFDDFLHMGGYGLYVWGAYGACLLLMALEARLSARRHARALQAEPLEDLA